MSRASVVRATSIRVGVAGALVAGGVVGMAAASSASIYCDPGTSYRITSYSKSFRPAANTYVKDGRGGTMTVSVEEASTLSGTFGTKVESEVGAIFAKIKAEVNAEVTKSKTVTTGHHYSHKIPRGMFGNVEFGSWGTSANWQQVSTYSNCGQDVRKSGTAKLPGKGFGWLYWSTKN